MKKVIIFFALIIIGVLLFYVISHRSSLFNQRQIQNKNTEDTTFQTKTDNKGEVEVKVTPINLSRNGETIRLQ